MDDKDAEIKRLKTEVDIERFKKEYWKGCYKSMLDALSSQVELMRDNYEKNGKD